MQLDTLAAWINTHDCGVQPTAVVAGDAIEVRVLAIHRDGSEKVETTTVRTLKQARDALGY